jgi:alanine dehydrogenase
MRIGIPREIKTLEARVGLVPAACRELIAQGHEVCIESRAGEPSGYPDPDYVAAGVAIVPDAAALYESADLIVKVKEPVAGDLEHLRRRHLLFCYLHLAADHGLAKRLAGIGLTAIAYETVAEGRALPLLAPMSDIAGRIAVQIGASLLYRPQGGRGLLLGGLAGAERGRVVVIGAGVAGGRSVEMAARLGAEVTAFDRNLDKLDQMRALGDNVTGLYAYADGLRRAVEQADLLIGAVLITGARTPRLVTTDMVRAMRPGSVIVDISVDQGGCVETIRPTSYAEPTYVQHGVVHFGVTNMPGAVPRSASQVLSAAVLPYLARLAGGGWEQDAVLRAAVNVHGGEVTHPVLRGEMGLD